MIDVGLSPTSISISTIWKETTAVNNNTTVMDIRFSNRVCYLCVCFASCLGFNIDTDKVLTFRGPEGSYFGYSAVMYSIGDQKW